MKYFILAREKNPLVIVGKRNWTFMAIYETFEEVENIVNNRSNVFSELEYKVIKGEELPWEEEIEEVVKKETVIIKRLLKDIEK